MLNYWNIALLMLLCLVLAKSFGTLLGTDLVQIRAKSVENGDIRGEMLRVFTFAKNSKSVEDIL